MLLREKLPILLVETHSGKNHRTPTQMFGALSYDCADVDGNHILALPR